MFFWHWKSDRCFPLKRKVEAIPKQRLLEKSVVHTFLGGRCVAKGRKDRILEKTGLILYQLLNNQTTFIFLYIRHAEGIPIDCYQFFLFFDYWF